MTSSPETVVEVEKPCPPKEARAAEGEYWRCCKHDPVHASDMETHAEQDRLPDADPCKRRALSVFQDQEDAEHQVRLFRRWKKKRVAKATLSAAHGLVLRTHGQQPTHTSWWPAENLTPAGRAALFSLVYEVD